METKSMQEMLERLHAAGKIEAGKTYQIMPSDCRGDGYDIAMQSRPDEGGEYILANGLICDVSCSARCGSQKWDNGIPVSYRLHAHSAASDEADRPKTATDCIGWEIYALCRRMGGKFRDISCLTKYEVSPRKTMIYRGEILSCVANKSQFAEMENLTRGYGYVVGRPRYQDVVNKLMTGELR